MIEEAHLPHQVRAQGEAMIARTSVGLELHLVSLTQLLHSRTSWRRATTHVGRGLLIIPWKMMLWVKPYDRFLDPLLWGGLIRLGSLIGFPSQRLPFIMEGLILLSMSVTLIRRWPSMPTMRPLCARCSPLALGQSPCVGLMLCRRDQLGPLRSW